MRPDGDNLLRQNPRNVGSAFSTDMFKLNGGYATFSTPPFRMEMERLTQTCLHDYSGVAEEVRVLLCRAGKDPLV